MTSMWSDTKPIGTITAALARSFGEALQVVVDVGLEPRHLRRTGARAVDELAAVPGAGLVADPLHDLGRRRCGAGTRRPARAARWPRSSTRGSSG